MERRRKLSSDSPHARRAPTRRASRLGGPVFRCRGALQEQVDDERHAGERGRPRRRCSREPRVHCHPACAAAHSFFTAGSKITGRRESAGAAACLDSPDHPPLTLRLRRAMCGVPNQFHAARADLLRASESAPSTWRRARGEPMNNDIIETAAAAGTFRTLAAALREADLVNTLKSAGPSYRVRAYGRGLCKAAEGRDRLPAEGQGEAEGHPPLPRASRGNSPRPRWARCTTATG